jgi:hypothetical protein
VGSEIARWAAESCAQIHHIETWARTYALSKGIDCLQPAVVILVVRVEILWLQRVDVSATLPHARENLIARDRMPIVKCDDVAARFEHAALLRMEARILPLPQDRREKR